MTGILESLLNGGGVICKTLDRGDVYGDVRRCIVVGVGDVSCEREAMGGNGDAMWCDKMYVDRMLISLMMDS